MLLLLSSANSIYATDANAKKLVDFLEQLTNKKTNQFAKKNNNPHNNLTVEQWVKVALQHANNRRQVQAIDTLNEAINRYPKADKLYAVRASLQLERHQISQALQDLNRAIDINSYNPSYYLNRYVIYRQYKQDEQGLMDLNKAIALDGDFYPAYFNRGSLYFKQGKFKQSLSDFNQCIVINPHIPSAYFNRASVYYELNNKKAAIADLKYFMTLNKKDSWQKIAKDMLNKWQK